MARPYAVLLLCALVARDAAAQGGFPKEILEARLGLTISICGVVVQESCRPPDDSHLTLETPKGSPRISIVVPRALRDPLGPGFEMGLHFLPVCAIGRLSKPNKDFLLTVDDPSTLRLQDGATAHVYPADVAFVCDPDVIVPKLRREVKPSYTRDALEARVQGNVQMTAVVEPDGRARDVRVVRSLRKDLDDEAVNALRRWQFQPGTRNGVPAPVVVSVEMAFTLRK